MDYLRNELNKKTILVTGASGFVGSHLTKDLINYGANLSILSRGNLGRVSNIENKLDIIHGDLSDLKIEKKKKFDFVFHLAALTDIKRCNEHPSEAFYNNVIGTLNLLENLSEVERFIYVSTLGVYGNSERLPVREDHVSVPIENYASSKQSAESLVMGYCNSKQIGFSIARLFNVYGPSQNKNFVIPKIISNAINNGNVELQNLETTRDFIYIDDVVSALEIISLKGENEIYNVGTGKETSIKELLNIIEKILNKDLTVKLMPYNPANNVTRSVADISKIGSKLNWKPTVNIYEGLRKMVKNFKNES